MPNEKQFPSTPAPQATSRTGLIFAFVLVIVSIAAGVPIAKMLTAPKPTPSTNQDIRIANANAPAAASVPADMHRYQSAILSMTLLYPRTWRRVADETQERFEGEDGFFQIVAAPSGLGSIDDVATNETERTPALFGSKPQVTKNQLRGLAVRVILPSPDQNPALKGMIALVIEMPRPVIIEGTSYPYLVLYADGAHMETIGSSVTFDLKTTK